MTTQFPIIKSEADSKVHLLGESPEVPGDAQEFASLLEVDPANESTDLDSTNVLSGLLADNDSADINALLADLQSDDSIAQLLLDVDAATDQTVQTDNLTGIDPLTQRIQQSQTLPSPLASSIQLSAPAQTQTPTDSTQLASPIDAESTIEQAITQLAGGESATADEGPINQTLLTGPENNTGQSNELLQENAVSTSTTTAVGTAAANENSIDLAESTQNAVIDEANAAAQEISTGNQADTNTGSQNQNADLFNSSLQSDSINGPQSTEGAGNRQFDDILFDGQSPDVNQRNNTQNTDFSPLNIQSIASAKLSQYQSIGEANFAYQSIGDNVRQVLSDSISTQTIDAINNGVLKTNEEGFHSFEIEIHPVELGKLNIEVDVNADSIQARIVATENFSADLLSRNKTELMNALSDFGYSETNVDISHQDSQNNHEPQEFDFSESLPIDLSQPIDTPSSVVVRVGVDLVA